MRFARLASLLVALVQSATLADDLLMADTPVEQAIDHFIDARLQRVGVSPAPQADDANLLRRTSLDLIGRIPTAAEARAYVELADNGKRLKLVERLLTSPAFVRQQVAEFDALLMDGTKSSLKGYLTRAFQENRSWDRMFRDMVAGESDDSQQKGAIRFVASRAKDQDKLTVDTSVLFFGVNVSCAKCHDHPLVADWKQDHYYGMLSFFSRTFEVGEFFGEREYGSVSFKTVEGESKDAKLMFLTGTVVDEPPSAEPDNSAKREEKKRIEEWKKKKEPPPPPSYSRRSALVEAALADDQSAFFARAIVNHLWNRFFGRGLVNPVDQMHAENAASHPELLAWLARDVQASGYDLKRLIRGIVLSQAYARSSRWDSADRRPPDSLLAVAIVRPLKPWQYGTSLLVATQSPGSFPADVTSEEFDKRIESLESTGRGLCSQFELPTADFQVGADEALLLSNGPKMAQELLRGGNDRLLSKLAECPDAKTAAEIAIWNVFARPPAAEEVKALTEFLAQRSDRPDEARQQMLWALLTSSECRFNY
jgi:hypothetical protein